MSKSTTIFVLPSKSIKIEIHFFIHSFRLIRNEGFRSSLHEWNPFCWIMDIERGIFN